jgi:2'-5' RNA ligase
MRLFVALWPPAEVVEHLQDAVREVSGRIAAPPGLRWVKVEQLHLTLAFLGEVDPPRAQQVQERLARVGVRHPPVGLRLQGAGRFGDRVLYVRVEGDREQLGRLATSVAAAARRSGLSQQERSFRAHLTLARGRPGARLRELAGALDGYRGSGWTAHELHLVHSSLGAGEGGRPVYRTLASWPLTGRLRQGR